MMVMGDHRASGRTWGKSRGLGRILRYLVGRVVKRGLCVTLLYRRFLNLLVRMEAPAALIRF